MPLPLIAIGIGVGAVGAAGTLIAVRKMRKDKKRYDYRRSHYESHHETYEEFVNEVKADIWNLHLQRVAAAETLREAADFLVKANMKDRSWNINSGITPEQFAELQDVITSLRNIVANAASAVAGGAAAGTAAAASAYAIAAAFGTASTGAAISGLSGIAARNAILAWLGGGSLAAGGGGMAAGALTLVNIALAPLALLPAVVMSMKAREQSRRINESISEMDFAEAEIDRHRAELTVVQNRTVEVSKAVDELHQALKDILEMASPDRLEDVYRVYLAAKALAELLDLDSAPRQLPES